MVIRLTTLEALNWKRASASQVKTADLCLRKWWFQKIAGIEMPPKYPEALLIGKRTHKILEFWVENCRELGRWRGEETWETFKRWVYTQQLLGRCPELPIRLAYNARGWIVQTIHLATVEVELEFMFKTNHGDNVTGFIDVLDDTGVTDYKTCKDYRFIPSEQELRNDPQCVFYMRHWFSRWVTYQVSSKAWGRYQHIYMNKTDGGVRSPLSFTVNRSENEDKFGLISDKVLTLRHYSKALVSTDVPAFKGSACDAYGGCEYQNQCSAYNKSKHGGTMGMFDKVIKKVQERGSKMAKETQNEYKDNISTDLKANLMKAGFSEAQTSEMNIAEMARLNAKIKQDMLTPEDLKACKVNPPDGTPDDEVVPPPPAAYSLATLGDDGPKVKDAKSAQIKEFFGERWGLSPKDAGALLKGYAAARNWDKKELRAQISKLCMGMNCILLEIEVLPDLSDRAEKAPPEKNAQAERRRNKPSLREIAPSPKDTIKPEKETHTNKLVQAKAKEMMAKQETQIKAAMGHKPKILCVDCMLTQGNFTVVQFTEWAAPAINRVQEEMPEILWSCDKFNEGAKAAAALIHKALTLGDQDFDLAPLPPVMVISSWHPLYNYLSQLFTELYGVVIHG